MEKRKWERKIPTSEIDRIMDEKFPERKCTKCGVGGLTAGGIERQYDEISGEYMLCSFSVWCHSCGEHCGEFDNNRCDSRTQRFLS